MTSETRTRVVHALFDLSVAGKGIDGLLEIVGGILLLCVSPQRIVTGFRVLSQHELVEDARDVLGSHLLPAALHLTHDAKTFAAVYLLWHGAVKIALVVGLLLRRRAAYPLAIGAFALFVVYQLYRYTHTRSVGLLVLTALDLLVIGLTWLEYRRLLAIHGFAGRRDGLRARRRAAAG